MAREDGSADVDGTWEPGGSGTAGEGLADGLAWSDMEDEPVTMTEEEDGLSVAVQVVAAALRGRRGPAATPWGLTGAAVAAFSGL